ncbi:unnamed protein product, partial [Gulo gulo]
GSGLGVAEHCKFRTTHAERAWNSPTRAGDNITRV